MLSKPNFLSHEVGTYHKKSIFLSLERSGLR